MLKEMDAAQISNELLIQRDHLPLKPSAVRLQGDFVRLEPLDIERDAADLYEVSSGKAINFGERILADYDANHLIWRHMVQGPFENLSDFKSFLQSQVDALNGLCFSVFDLAVNRPIGVVNLMSNQPENLKIEIGSLWYSPIAQRTHANTEAAYLILEHAFKLGYRRVEWKCHAHNERSRRAALRVGFTFEGIQESHMIVKGCNRDTAWFRMLQSEWSDRKEKLEKLLYSNPNVQSRVTKS